MQCDDIRPLPQNIRVGTHVTEQATCKAKRFGALVRLSLYAFQASEAEIYGMVARRQVPVVKTTGHNASRARE